MFDLLERFHQCADDTGERVGLLFEAAVQQIYERWLQPGDIAVDVGAHKGAHLFPMVRAVGPRGRVYAFEPIGTLYKRLRRDLKKRQIRNVKLHELALGAEAKTAAFSYFEKRPAYSGLQRRKSPFSAEEGGLCEIKVRQVTLDSKLSFWHKVAAIKLDIEGGELHALMGARKCLKRSRPLVIFENGRQSAADTYGYTKDDFFNFFDAVNMQVFLLSGEPFTPDMWSANIGCWEFVALPAEKAAFAERLPELCQQVLDT